MGEPTERDRTHAALLTEMACVYPGDPDGTLMREACELLGEIYEPPEIIITYGETP